MAWTLHLIVGITVVTVSAYNCKITAYADTESDPRRNYDYQNQGIPENVAYSRMNARSAELSPSYSPIVKPYVQSRQGSNNENYKIVFPGPTASTEEYQLEIPEHCKKLGICEDLPNYPKEAAKKAIAEISDINMLQNDKLDLPDVPDITQRVGPQEENIELCSFQEKIVYPKAAVDNNGQWHVVLNQDDNPVQGFKVEICDVDSSPCTEVAIFQPGYSARCKQKYVYRKMAVLQNGTRLEKSLKVPSCCSCVAKLDSLR